MKATDITRVLRTSPDAVFRTKRGQSFTRPEWVPGTKQGWYLPNSRDEVRHSTQGARFRAATPGYWTGFFVFVDKDGEVVVRDTRTTVARASQVADVVAHDLVQYRQVIADQRAEHLAQQALRAAKNKAAQDATDTLQAAVRQNLLGWKVERTPWAVEVKLTPAEAEALAAFLGYVNQPV